MVKNPSTNLYIKQYIFYNNILQVCIPLIRFLTIYSELLEYKFFFKRKKLNNSFLIIIILSWNNNIYKILQDVQSVIID